MFVSLLLMLVAPQVRAGYYSGPVYSGTGTESRPSFTHLPPAPYANTTETLNGQSFSGWGGWASNSGGDGSPATCTGTIIALFTWQPAYTGDLPPTQVITAETSTAYAWGMNTPPKPVGGQCNNGIGISQSSLTQSYLTSGTPPRPYETIGTSLCSSTRYQVLPGGMTVKLTVSPSASVSSYPNNNSSVIYNASVYPVHINPNGATADSSHNLDILVGQQCEGIMGAGPASLSNYQWTIPGVTFDHFYVSSDQAQGYPVFINPSVWATANPFWRWSSSGGYTLSVTAQASINGQVIGPVTAKQNINVITPLQIVVATPGSASSFETTNGVVTAIQAGPSGGAGITVDATVTTPNPFAQIDQYYGSYYYVQLFDEYCDVTAGSVVIPYITNGFVLDNEDPYNGIQSAYNPDSVKLTPFELSDNPDLGVLPGVNPSVSVGDQFKTYVMYTPPSNGNDVQPVPIHLTQWMWTANAGVNNQGIWGPNPPGSCIITSDSPSTEFPTWSASFVNKPNNTGRKERRNSLSYPFDEINFDKMPISLVEKK